MAIEISKMAIADNVKQSIDEAVQTIYQVQVTTKEQKKVEEINKDYLLSMFPKPDTYLTETGTFTVACRKESTKKEVDIKRLLTELPLIAGQNVLDKLIELGIVYDKTTPECTYVTKIELR